MDIVDYAQNQVEKALDFQIKNLRRQAANDAVLATGFCLFCGEKVAKNRRWCDADCRDLWEKKKRQRGLNVL